MNLFSSHPLPKELDSKLIAKDMIKEMTYLGKYEQLSLILLLIEQLIINGLFDKLLLLLKTADLHPQNQEIIDELQKKNRISLSTFENIQSKDQKMNGLKNIYVHIINQKFGSKNDIEVSSINKHLIQQFAINIQIFNDNAIRLQSQIKINGNNDAILYITKDKQYAIRLPQQQQSQQSSLIQQQSSFQSQSQSLLQSQLQSQSPQLQSQSQSQSSTLLSKSSFQKQNNCVNCYQIGKQFLIDEQQYKKYLNQLVTGNTQFECQYCKQKYNQNDIQDYIKLYRQRFQNQQQSSITQKNLSNINLKCRNCEVLQENQGSLINNICTKCNQYDKGLNSQPSSQIIKSKVNYYEDKDVVCNLCQKYCNPNNVFKLSCGHIYCFQCGEQIKKQTFFKCKQSTCNSQFEQNVLIRQLNQYKQVQETKQDGNKPAFNRVESIISNQSNIQDNYQKSQIDYRTQTLSQQSLQQTIQPNYLPSKIIQSKQESKIQNNLRNCQMCNEDFNQNNIQVQMQCQNNHVIGVCCFISEYKNCMICETKTPYQLFRFQYQPFQKQKLYQLSNPNDYRKLQPNRYQQNPQQVQDDQRIIPYRENIAVIRTPQQIKTTSQPHYRQ